MSKKVTSTLVIILSIIVLFLLALAVFHFTSQKQEIVFVNNVTWFNEFNMAKDMGRKHKVAIEKQKKSFDSLYTVYNILKEQKSIAKLPQLEQQLQQKDAELKQMEAYLSKDVSQQVWNRLNTYIKDYGKVNEYQLILGTQGSGNIMYGEESLDITLDLLEYANTKYEGN